MKTVFSNSPKFDDVIFENRNQRYGAYALRKSYSERANFAMFISLSLTLAIFIIPNLLKSNDSGPISKPKDEVPINLNDVFVIEKPKPPVPKSAGGPKAATQKTVIVPTKVVTVDVLEKSPIIDESKAITFTPPDPNANENGNSDISENPTTYGNGDGNKGTIPVPNGPIAPDAADVKPEFPGGEKELLKYIGRNYNVPSSLSEKENGKKLFISWVVDKEGRVTDVKIIRGICDRCDKEAIEVIEAMPRWKPGIYKGFPVSVRYSIPIVLKID